MRRALPTALAVLTLTACSPLQRAAWDALTPEQQTAIAGALTALPNGQHVACEQWLGTSRVAGFTDAEIPTEHAVMFAESRCDPSAYNPSGARGLMQVLGMWHDDCGLATADELLDPQLNLDCALHVLDVQGWHAWSTYPPW